MSIEELIKYEPYKSCYEYGEQQGRADALDHCDRCETEQWDALYKAEMKGRADGVREFAEWLSNTEYVANHDSFILPLRGYFTIDEVVAEWVKEQKK